MCLYVDLISTQKELAKDTPLWTFYKTFVRKKGIPYIETPYHEFKVHGPGIIQIPEPIKSRDLTGVVGIERGIFNARTKEEATKQDKFYAEYFTRGEFTCVCVPIIVKKEDIIAFGILEDVGILAYEITQEVWKNAIKK
jgi:hypothetical protein